MKRALSGSLEHLAPQALLRLVSATSPSGVLELVTEVGSLRLEVERGRVAVPSPDDLRHAARVLSCSDGFFRFEPTEPPRIEGEALSLTAFAEAAFASRRESGSSDPSVEIERLFDEEIFEIAQLEDRPNIHVLPSEPPQNPLEDLLADLEAEAPGELLFAQVGVVAQDPTVWRGALESGWRRRGWEVRLFALTEEVPLEGLDVLVVHHQQATVRAGRETAWLRLIKTAEEAEPRVPVVWVAPLGDPVWTHQLITGGVSFLMPAPQGSTGEALARFSEALSLVVDRQLQARRVAGGTELPAAVSDLVDALLHDSKPEQAVGSLLQLAAEQLSRGAVLMVEETAIRCRAGFGYPLDRDDTALPRGVGLLERVIRSGEALTEIEPVAGGALRLARVLGVAELPEATAVIPLGRGGAAAGLLVADREGGPLPDLAELILLAGRLGGVIVGA